MSRHQPECRLGSTTVTESARNPTYYYDADGERTQEAISGTTTVSASYNGAQRLTSYSDGAADMSAASYDGDGLRQSETSTPTGGSATTEDFTWNPSTSVPQLLMDSDNAYIYGSGNAPIEQVSLSTGTITYLVSDLLGSVRGTVDTSGSLTATTAYDAWGNPETTGGLTTTTPFGYAGSYTDPSGLLYLIDRYYDPTTGQFLTVDPLVDTTGQAYAYGSDDPVLTSDPSGLCALSNGPGQTSFGGSPSGTYYGPIDIPSGGGGGEGDGDGDGDATPSATPGPGSPAPSSSGSVPTPAELNPTDMTTGQWGRAIWGQGPQDAIDRIGTRSAAQLRALGLNEKIASGLRDFYIDAEARGTGGPAAPARVRLLDNIIDTLRGK